MYSSRFIYLPSAFEMLMNGWINSSSVSGCFAYGMFVASKSREISVIAGVMLATKSRSRLASAMSAYLYELIETISAITLIRSATMHRYRFILFSANVSGEGRRPAAGLRTSQPAC